MELPKRYNAQEAEIKWLECWEKEKIYAFDPESKAEVYSVDTPPPTVSGQMHIGHAFMYSQMDFIARYQRMRGKNVFYPFGTDDNGLATERLVEKLNNVHSVKMKRSEFIDLCLSTLNKIRPSFIQDWKNIGISCDFSLFYSTINTHCRRISQWSFIDLFKKGRVYRKDAPSIWCPECQTGIAQVDLEDSKLPSTFNAIIFKVDNEDLIISTTRPELLSSCVAIFAHPDDKRYKKYFGKKAVVPIFKHNVPILMDERADSTKGTGVVMCCTFGDQTDIEWYKAYNLPLRESITKEGKMTNLAGTYKGLTIKQCREKIIVDLKNKNLLVNSKPITHTVNVHERCSTPIEILHSKQWYIKYLDLKDQFLKNGAEMKWYPKHMRYRLNNWIYGLQWDWCISRQRHFGVPFPLWYCENCGKEVLADEKDLPIDPIEDSPPIKKCEECGGTKFIPEKDVQDTWPTSALTPQLAGELIKGTPNYDKIYPMNVRPQGHDIINFWLFNSLVKSQLHFNKNPWENIMITGFALDPHGKKMSKSKGNIIDPRETLKKYSADALRFWAAGSKLGDDLPFQEKDLVTGQKFTTKIWNASKFAFMHLVDYNLKKPKNLDVMDRWILSKLSNLIKESTENFMNYEYSHTKLSTETFFWHTFCDNYLEIIKDRVYNAEKRGKEARLSAQYGLYHTLLTTIKLMAPITPFITEELYHAFFKKHETSKSIHLASWPKLNLIDEKAEKIGDFFVYVLQHIRRAKSEKNLSLKIPVKKIIAKGKITKADFEKIKLDLIATTNAEEIVFETLNKDSKIDYEVIVDI
jgi:valyl-tRNA synthetase